MKNGPLNTKQRLWLELLWFGARLFAVMPYWFKYYVAENLIYVLLRFVLRYRLKVVKTNLHNAFPDKTPMERVRIRRRFYRTLAEVAVDTVNMAHMTPQKARRALTIANLEPHRQAVKGRDWIAMTAHFGCWEYCSYWGVYEPSQMLVAVYHPLRSAVVEELYQRLRNYENSMTVAMRESLRFYLRNREHGVEGKNLVMGLIADQNPPRRPDNHWFRFLNQDTVFFDGGEKLALRCQLPVYFVGMKRLKRGRYEMSCELLYDGVEEVEPHEITERYVRRLERMICECPELWMWSHRRWKQKRPNANH